MALYQTSVLKNYSNLQDDAVIEKRLSEKAVFFLRFFLIFLIFKDE